MPTVVFDADKIQSTGKSDSEVMRRPAVGGGSSSRREAWLNPPIRRIGAAPDSTHELQLGNRGLFACALSLG